MIKVYFNFLILVSVLVPAVSLSALDSKEKSAVRGSIVFRTYCVLCHGESGDGKGRLAVGKVPPPANLTITKLTDVQKEEIIRNGGAGVGRSPFMPPWKEELSEEQIRDLISYINLISKSK
ncbi:cytochrome c [Leptospira kmetyi]|nr:cytochrome c [Leptospira kmetyi]EQA55049.1 cytochrome C [Leptospira kmetyi serovar Malaysia str. Bejo-Iso9]TGK16864.1 cytochrome c [Leptospira kmetyi]TGK33045.1 cytochrome c [Leptospira kmetyi]TGL70540.1 cytochrome c [Leptospira kmetyi]